MTIAMQGDFGKTRPALVIQASLFSGHASATVLRVTNTLVAAPLLRVMVHKVMTLKRDWVGPAFGRLDANAMVEAERCLAVFLGIAK